MNNSEQFERLLKQALSSTVEPGEDLNQKIIKQMKENDIMKPVHRKRISFALTAAAITLAISITAFAAWRLLSPKQVAEHLQDKALAHAFESNDAIEINKSVVSGGYNFTLHGIVSGKSLSDFRHSSEDIHPDRTYAVVSIAKQDGSKMPDTKDEEYGQVRFFISPLIKGQKPWQVNIASMNGGYSEVVIDGVMYRLIECDGIEMFADRGIYLCISTSDFYDVNAFNYNEETGEVSPNPDYKGANALFDLPIDVKKADHEKAEEYLRELLKVPEKNRETDLEKRQINLEKEAANGVVIPESVKEVTYDENGLACYEFKGWKVSISIDEYFKEGEIDVYKTVSISEEDGKKVAVQFSKGADGVITGRVLELK